MSFRQMGIASEANLQSTFLVHLTEHLIEEILVRIATPCDLVRASAACASFRRLVAAASFLRRYRSLHPPVLLGVLSPMGFLPAEVPHPNALAAYALARDADFQHQFRQLPPRQQRCWSHCDARDGRVLWKSSHSASGLALPQLAVCDPLTRGYTLLPPIPEGLVASQLLGPALDVHFDCFDAFFVPSGDYEEAHFRVIGWTHCKAMAAVFVYSSLSGAWTAGTSTTWNALGLVVEAEPENALGLVVEAEPDNALGLVVEAEHENALGLVVEAEPENALGLVVEAEPENALGLVVEAEPEIALGLVEWPSYVYGCFYWHVCRSNMLLKLDINRMEFSAVGLPPVCENQCLVVAAEAGEGRIGILKHIAGQGIPQSLCYSVRQNEGENANGHPVETTIQLPSDYDKYWVVAAAQGYIFLEASRFVYQQGTHRLIGGSSAFFSLEIKTLKIQRVCSTRGALCDHVLPYFGFPSFMSPARI